MQIVDDKKDAYKKYLHKNIDSLFDDKDQITKEMPASYILAIMLATELVGESLDDGDSPQIASNKMAGMGLTGYMAGMAVAMVVRFHPRGEELRIWWNKQWGMERKEKGTINPALIKVSTKKKKAVN